MTQLSWFTAAIVVGYSTLLPAQEILPDGTDAAQRAISGFRVPNGMKVELFAAEPQLSGPVALCLDEQGRVFVAEEYRFNRGTEENRTRPFLLDVDLQIDSLEQRLAAFEKYKDEFEGGMEWFTKVSDQIRLLEDTDGDGRADKSSVFAKFNEPLDGLAAGVIARDGDVYVTCIPSLWLMRDEDGDGVADLRKSLHRGFGVNNAFLGHDLHGLAWGPDGRLYFSVGDRGYNLVNKEGEHLYGPRRGAVFRCEPDGSNLEVVHTGLRNPQELAFDELGNLFAADNNCDKGDLSRLVYVVEGGDSGWNMAYQTIPDPYLTGPWHAEKLWHVNAPDRPAYVTPPVGALGAGPSGFTYYPGVGLPERYKGHFFLCNYTGNGGIESFAVRQKGAGFEIVDEHDFLKPIKATDVDFGYDGKMYVSDFVNLDWSGKSLGGRIYTVFDPKNYASMTTRHLSRMHALGIDNIPSDELVAYLDHDDFRVRLAAQHELAGRYNDPGEYNEYYKTRNRLAQFHYLAAEGYGEDWFQQPFRVRLHALWGLGEITCMKDGHLAVRSLREILRQKEPRIEPELRAQIARMLGDARDVAAQDQLEELLSDESPRVQFFAAQALGRIGRKESVEPLLELLRDNHDRDRFVTHAAIVALDRIGDTEELLAHATDASASVRRAIAVVLRRQANPEIVRFLADSEMSIVTEAALAINDLPIDSRTTHLARLADRFVGEEDRLPDALVRRIINANYRIGKESNAARLVRLATVPTLNMAMRSEALACLSAWGTAANRDRVTGFWRPLSSRDVEPARLAVQGGKNELLRAVDGELLPTALDLLTKHGVPVNDSLMVEIATDSARDDVVRVAALGVLDAAQSLESRKIVRLFGDSRRPALRIAAWKWHVESNSTHVIERFLEPALSEPKTTLQEYRAILDLLVQLDSKDADDLLLSAMVTLTSPDQQPNRWTPIRELELDIIDSANSLASKDNRLRESLTNYRSALNTTSEQPDNYLIKHRASVYGGSAVAGEAVFRGHRRAQCLRCHKVRGNGGTAGPDLTKVADRAKGDRWFLLESLINPHAKIAKGFGSVTFVMDDGRVLTGVVESESDGRVVVKSPEGKVWNLNVDNIDVRTDPKSPMPSMEYVLSAHELRDLVEYLSTLKTSDK